MLTYTYRYNRVIKWFKDHPVSKETCQCENHHIIPRSCGGLDIKENLVLLPLRWHYIVHCWLPMVYAEAGMQKEYNAMLFAWNRFQNCSKGFREGLQTIKEDSLLYQKLRQEYISLVSSTIGQKIEGKRNGRYNTHWWKDPNDKTKTLAIKDGDPVPVGWVCGRWITNEQRLKCKEASSGRSWYYNPTTKETKHTKLSPEEEQHFLSNGWQKGRNPDHLACLSIKTYTNDGKNRLKIKEGETIPEGYVLLYLWNQQHPKRKKTDEELKAAQKRAADAAAKVMHEKNQQWIKENIALWKEMYLWYLDNNEDFEALCAKYNYTKGKTNFQYLIRKYLPEIYKFDTRKYSKPRPKTRGPYKKRKQLSV